MRMYYFTAFKRIPLFIYAPPAEQIIQFNGKNLFFSSDKLPNNENTKTLPEKFTIVFGLKITKCPKRY